MLVILYFVSKDYFLHKKAFENKQTVKTLVLEKDCRRKGASYIYIEDKGKKGFVEALDGKCEQIHEGQNLIVLYSSCLLYTSPSPRDLSTSRMPSSA